jgi:hypothetical protein
VVDEYLPAFVDAGVGLERVPVADLLQPESSGAPAVITVNNAATFALYAARSTGVGLNKLPTSTG